MSRRDNLHTPLRPQSGDYSAMDRTLSYAEILKKTVQGAVAGQPRIQAVKLYPVCDTESGHVLVLAIGWDKKRWTDAVLFRARLVD
ncbi:MAG: hypothetical protein AAGA67_10520 [Cyanobacteria bacterium P01_F01_bin.153]